MMNSAKRSNRQIRIAAVICLVLISAIGCSKNEKSDKYVIKVNDTVLTEEQINLALSEKRNSGKLRAEFIQDWIEKEVLFQEAVKNDILDEKEFNMILVKNKKELAAAMLLNKVIAQENTEPSEDEIRQYFESNKDEFKLNDDLFHLNIVYFNDFDIAVQFRNTAIETSWNNGLKTYQNYPSVTSVESSQLISRYQLQPLTFLRSVAALQKGETSIIIETEPARFAVVQLIEKLGKDVIPSLEVVREDVKARLTMIKIKEILKKYIDKLIADHNLDIKRYSE